MIEFRIQEKTKSLNESFRGDWRPRAAVAKRQRSKAMGACPKWPGGPLLMVRLTRVSPGTLDSDALPAALKHVRDGVADRLKIDDASPLVAWEYHQTKGQAEVVVQIWSAWASRPPLPEGRPVERKRPLLPSERVSKALRASVPGVIATVAADAGKRLRVARVPGKGEKRAPREFETSLRKPSTVKVGRKPAANYVPPETKKMRELSIRAAAESIAQAHEGPALRAVLRKPRSVSFNDAMDALVPERRRGIVGKPPFAVRVESSGYDPGKEAERRAMLAAQEAEATFAPGARSVPKEGEGCGNCDGIHPESCMFRSNH